MATEEKNRHGSIPWGCKKKGIWERSAHVGQGRYPNTLTCCQRWKGVEEWGGWWEEQGETDPVAEAIWWKTIDPGWREVAETQRICSFSEDQCDGETLDPSRPPHRKSCWLQCQQFLPAGSPVDGQDIISKARRDQGTASGPVGGHHPFPRHKEDS